MAQPNPKAVAGAGATSLFPLPYKKRHARLFLPKYLTEEANTLMVDSAEIERVGAILKSWADAARDGHLDQKETSLDGEFLQKIFGEALNYKTVTESPHDYHREKNPTVPGIGIADGALEIIKSIRSRTTAEVLMQTDRVGSKWPQDNADDKADKGQWWDYLMNHRFLPDIAKKYGCAIVDIRGGWLEYLHANHYEPTQLLLKDGAHLNVQGNFLMARLTEQYLVYRPELSDTSWKRLTHDYPISAGDWKDGKLTIEFEGNRADILPAIVKDKGETPPGGAARIRIDDKKPSEFPGAYRITRPTPGPWSPLFLSRVDHDTPLVLEEWTLKVKNVSADGKTFDFDVNGSVTGPDGSGKSAEPFIGKSGRVKIDPAAWFRGFHPPLPAGYTIKWKVLPMFVDAYQPKKVEDPTIENAVVAIQGIENGKHVLEIIAEDSKSVPAIAGVRAYRPPVKGD